MLALERAGSLFTGWIRSCFTFLPGDDGCQPRQAGNGVEREMKICHTQPHLVPPMKLVVYDNLPSPSVHQSRNSLSSWFNDSRNLASRASNRASMSLKRSSTTPLKISAPSDFRRVQSFHDHPHSFNSPPPTYQPLDLRIHRSGNRLSELPSFETFQLNESPQRKTLPVPPRALTTPTNVRDRYCQKAFVVSRKPVGSQKRRSLGNMESLLVEEPVRATSTLVPHFSKVIHTEKPLPEAQAASPIHGRSKSEGSKVTSNTRWPNDANTTWGRVPRTPPASNSVHRDSPDTSPSKYSAMSKDSPSSASSRTMISQPSSRRPSIPLPKNRDSIDAIPFSLSNRVTQWMCPTPTNSSPFPRQASMPGEKGFNWERTRTLSGTTVASTSTTTFTGGPRTRNNGSISSAFSSAITPRTSFQVLPSATEKDLDAGVCYPTIFEDQQQHHHLSSYHDNGHVRYQESSIGVAF
ncbi:hypothetical protein DTO013E5_4974 [Penicillium roqueforti]|uniref:Genomic scaffold, ProqFM164S03 n=1 Tax=Penicillium roqueforti (strain FM164) TaxID=1365484 RepID=W6QDB5_PENRF|nr:uncharacterized protein LCP9604111_5774 [Penicillium roqueforti]CDM34465.1 unnamed protein product [Penicillium roqueforti FM164]KAF9248065.1 hypothetical protein LCP9604111_5774 [Penicillium roqueforti]KAI2714809.1 hypothetical protein CBS147318_6386 [Penicillium roqueforti]KAI2742851.1 hypothetical protein DTO012A1_3513 [Penicillium roqueforti]KAI2755457.1 hypothetical protein DTO013F2_1140 [Penicillium roqueforti]